MTAGVAAYDSRVMKRDRTRQAPRRSLKLSVAFSVCGTLVGCDDADDEAGVAQSSVLFLHAPSTDPGTAPRSLAEVLPRAPAAFVAGTLVHGEDYTQRTYTRDRASVQVTVRDEGAFGARYYDSWAEMSARYPRAELDLPASAGVGFYECGVTGGQRVCDLHVHLRSGVHVELNGGGSATRADLDAIVRLVPLRRLASNAAQAPTVTVTASMN